MILFIVSILFSICLWSCAGATDPTSTEIPVTDISFEKTDYVIEVGASEIVNVNILPDNATNKTVTWKSSDTTVATVNNGVIKGISKGCTTITVKCGSITKTLNVTIVTKKIPVTGFSVSPESKSIVIGDEFEISTTITPNNATDKTVSWKSDKTSIARRLAIYENFRVL